MNKQNNNRVTSKKNHWEHVYESRSPQQVSWYQAEPGVSLHFIRAAGISHDAAIIDVGGGASVLADRLLDEGFSNITVMDISPSALAHARQRLGKMAGAVKWLEADVTSFRPKQQYMLWHDRAVLHFLTQKQERQKYVHALNEGLAPGGHLIVASFAKGGPERCSGLPIVQYDAARLLGELGPGFSLISERTEHHTTPGGGDQKFAWFHVQKH